MFQINQIKSKSTATLLTIIFEPKTAAFHECSTRFKLRHQPTRYQIKIKSVFLPDTLDVRLLGSSFAFSFCKLQLSYLQSMCVTMHVVMNWCVKCCRLVANLAQFLILAPNNQDMKVHNERTPLLTSIVFLPVESTYCNEYCTLSPFLSGLDQANCSQCELTPTTWNWRGGDGRTAATRNVDKSCVTLILS